MSGMSAGRPALRMGPAELVQAAAMARRFYLEGKSKIQIAEEFGVSRFKVARVLETALERDLVRIEIRVPAELDAERSDALRARYGLRHAVVVESPAEGADESPDPENLGEVAAELLGELVAEGDVLGLAWGRSTIHMAAALDRLPPCTVVQLTGVYDAGTAERGSVEAVRRAAQVSGGEAHPDLRPDAAARPGDRRGAPPPARYRPRVRLLRQGDGRGRIHRFVGGGHLHGPRHAHRRGTRPTTRRSGSPPRCPRTSSTPRADASAVTSASGASPSRPTGCAVSRRSWPSRAVCARPRRSVPSCAPVWSPAWSPTPRQRTSC